MVFGINRLFRLFRFLSFEMMFLYIKKKRYLLTYKENKLKLSIGCEIIDSSFGINNFLGENVSFVNSSIDDHSYVNVNSKIKNTKIGKFTSIGPNVQIVLGVHPSNFVSSHPSFYANNKPFDTFSDNVYIKEYNEVLIGNDVWIGEGVVIPGGVSIGNGAIITSRAVVTKDVEPYSIVGGVPAKHIKYRFDSLTVDEINKSEWWNWEDAELRRVYKDFHNTDLFLEKLKKK